MNRFFLRLGKRRTVLLILLVVITLVRFIPHLGEVYSRYVYPAISNILSLISAVFPFSLEEWIVVATIILMAYLPFRLKSKTAKRIITLEVEVLCWIGVWFYIGWGMNYYRDSFFERAGVQRAEVRKAEFMKFLNAYTENLNASYVRVDSIDEESVENEVKSIYLQLSETYGLSSPQSYQHPKAVAFNWLYSSVGVLGYMGPFADESQLNADLFPVQYPSTYAHELAHLLSVSSEAEATYWAYIVCTHSKNKVICYSGYLGILPNVARNAYSILSEKEFNEWKSRVSPNVMKDRKMIREFWNKQYSEFIGEIQSLMFNALLKGNKIPEGMKNYDGVLLMILSSQDKAKFLQ